MTVLFIKTAMFIFVTFEHSIHDYYRG